MLTSALTPVITHFGVFYIPKSTPAITLYWRICLVVNENEMKANDDMHESCEIFSLLLFSVSVPSAGVSQTGAQLLPVWARAGEMQEPLCE